MAGRLDHFIQELFNLGNMEASAAGNGTYDYGV
jgi:hypothetical protein